jgi:uncharacterized protein HemY
LAQPEQTGRPDLRVHRLQLGSEQTGEVVLLVVVLVLLVELVVVLVVVFVVVLVVRTLVQVGAVSTYPFWQSEHKLKNEQARQLATLH